MRNDTSVDDLVVRAVALGLLGRLLAAGSDALVAGPTLAEATEALELLADGHGATALRRLGEQGLDGAEIAASAVHWFDHGRVPPYEYSNVGPSVGGHTAGLADIAGFYGAFGVEARADRVDHLGTELEFLSLVTLREAEARRAGDVERAGVCADAARAFVRDHVGRWIDVWAARIADADPEGPWAPLGVVAARLVAAEARHRNVLPLRAAAVFDGRGASIDDDEVTCEAGLVVS